jgi:hypothetical protein
MTNPLPDDQRSALSELIFQQRKIEAIKLYRESTQVGLAEAKEAIEALEASLRKDFPDKFVAAPKGKGCFGVAAIVCIVGTVVVWLACR